MEWMLLSDKKKKKNDITALSDASFPFSACPPV